MALAGRVGDDAERYLKKHPAVGALFRRISDKRLSDEDLKKLNSVVEKMAARSGAHEAIPGERWQGANLVRALGD